MKKRVDNFQFIYNKFDIDHKDIIKSYINIQKMAWEQVLLLTLFSRQLCYNSKNEVGVMARMRLIHAAYYIFDHPKQEFEDEPKDSRLLKFVIEFIDNNEGSLEITKALLSHTNGEDKWSNECNSLLQAMQYNSIAFPPLCQFDTSHSWIYSYHALYIALSKPIALFQPLLLIPDINEEGVLNSLLLSYLKVYTEKKFRGRSSHSYFSSSNEENIIETVSKIEHIDALGKYVDENPEFINKPSFSLGFKVYLMERLGNSIKTSFECTKIPQIEKRIYGLNRGIFGQMCQSEIVDDKLSLNFEENQLRELVQLGLLDEVLKGIKSTLLKELRVSNQNPIYVTSYDDYGRAFDELSNWYQSCKTDLFKKLEQVPKLVAAIITFDVKNKRGLFSDEFNYHSFENVPKKLKAKDIALITTSVIHHCLYKNFDIQYFLYTAFQSGELTYRLKEDAELNEIITEVSEHLAGNNVPGFYLFKNKMMSNWQNLNSLSPAIERIKKLPSYLKSDITGEINSKLHNQRQKSSTGDAPYPITTSVPLPLWVSYQADISDSDNEGDTNEFKPLINE